MKENNEVFKTDVIKGSPQTSMKEVFIISSVSILCTIEVYKAVQYFKPKPNNQSAKSGTNYVFFSTEGKAMVFSEQDVFGIVQMYEDGVMPSVIASKYNVNAVMVCRIVNSFNSKN
jgi:hypothetical protein